MSFSRLVLRFIWVPLGGMVIGGAGMAYWTYLEDTQYITSAHVLIQHRFPPENASAHGFAREWQQPADVFRTLASASLRDVAETRLFRSRHVLTPGSYYLDWTINATQTVTIFLVCTSREDARPYLDGLLDGLIEFQETLPDNRAYSVRVLDRAEMPVAVDKLYPLVAFRGGMYGGFFGMILGFGILSIRLTRLPRTTPPPVPMDNLDLK